jgi:hypothetical protein
MEIKTVSQMLPNGWSGHELMIEVYCQTSLVEDAATRAVIVVAEQRSSQHNSHNGPWLNFLNPCTP